MTAAVILSAAAGAGWLLLAVRSWRQAAIAQAALPANDNSLSHDIPGADTDEGSDWL